MKLNSTSPPARRWAMSRARRSILKAPRHKQDEKPEQAQHQRRAEELRHPEDPHLGDADLEHAEQKSAHRQLGAIGRGADGVGGRAAARSRHPPWRKDTTYER